METSQERELIIQGMTCGGCATHVIKALKGVEGVGNVQLPDWKAGSATVQVNAAVTKQTLESAVDTAGYTAKVFSPQKPDNQSTNKQTDFDLIIIGTGGAGMGAAIKAAELGFSSAIIESGTIGGTCVNIGCVPSKALLRAAEAYHKAGHHGFKGVQTRAESLDWKTIMKEKDELVESLRQKKYIDVIDSYPEITLIQGTAQLQSDGSVLVDGDTAYSGKKVIIATGARPRILPLEGLEEVDVLTSTTAMELKKLPQSMIIIGGRFIALEQAQIFSRFGTKVTILQRSERLVPNREPEISEGIAEAFRDEGVIVHTKAQPISIKEVDGEKIITVIIDGKKEEIKGEQVLMAVGRVGNTDTLGLESLGVELDKDGAITVDDTLQTSHPAIYAAGDVSNRPQLVYVAAAAGGIAAENALTGTQNPLDLSVLPEVLFSDPQIATVGLTEVQAKEQGYDVATATLPLEYVPRAIAARDTKGLIKLISDRTTNQLIGAHILAAEGGELIQTAAMAIYNGKKYGFTVQDFRKMLFPYLVQVEGLKLATLTFDKEVAQLSCCAG